MGFFARIGRLFKGFVGMFVSGLEERNPEALMEAARQDFRDRMAQYNMALARMAGIAERLKTQIKTKSAKLKELERRVMANHRAGNMQLAGSLARELQEIRSDLEVDTTELKDTEEAYKANLRQAKVVQKDFEDKIRRLEKQLSQVKIKEAQAEAAAALGNVAFEIGDMGDTMKTVEEVLNKRYETSAGKARVATDMIDMEKLNATEKEQEALDQAALADFLAEQGIQAPGVSAGAPAAKEMGPSEAVSDSGARTEGDRAGRRRVPVFVSLSIPQPRVSM
ncbi:MAG: PspA/IM30 family protein [Planctomycetota bacterium]|nr:PspA/IM30 family protein [Planctomycetota bacterium]